MSSSSPTTTATTFRKVDFSVESRIAFATSLIAALLIVFILRFVFIFVCRIPLPSWSYAYLIFVPLFSRFTVFFFSFAYRYAAMRVGAKNNLYLVFESCATTVPAPILFPLLTVVVAIVSTPIAAMLSFLIIRDIPLPPSIVHQIEAASGIDRANFSPMRFGQVYWSRFFVAGCCVLAITVYALPLTIIVGLCFYRLGKLKALNLSERTLAQHQTFCNLLIGELVMEMVIMNIDLAMLMCLIFDPQAFITLYPEAMSVVSTQPIFEALILCWFLKSYRHIVIRWLQCCMPSYFSRRLAVQIMPDTSIIHVKSANSFNVGRGRVK